MRLVFCLALCTAGVLVSPPASRAQDPAAAIKQLESKDQAARLAALESLAKHPSKPKQAVEALGKALDHADPLTRAAAAMAAAAYGPRATPLVPKLSKLVAGDKEASVRASSARALGTLGTKTGPEVDVLMAAITDPDPRVRRAALASIRQLAPGPERTLPKFIAVLEDADPGAVVAALTSIADFGAAAVPPMMKALESEKAAYWALVVLGDIGPDAKDAIPQIKAKLADSQPEVRMQAAMALAGIGTAAASAAPELVAALDDKEKAVQYAVVFALGRIGDPSAMDGLGELESSDDPMLQLLSVWAEAEIQPDNAELQQEALGALSEAIKGDNVAARRAAAHALGFEKMTGDKVIELLLVALADKDDLVSRSAAQALSRKGAAAVEPVAALLSNPTERPKAAFLLMQYGADSKSAVPQLFTALAAEKEPAVKRLILLALAGAGVDDPAAASKLTPLLTDPEPRVARGATYVLGKMGPKAKAALPAIQKNLTSSDPDTRLISVWAILQIAPDERAHVAKAVPLLISALTHEMELARIEAATALGEMGPAAQTALPALRELLEYDTPPVRAAAEEAIKKIEGAGKG